MKKEKTRSYRRGIGYRKGDIDLNSFLAEFKFKNVEYDNSYLENDKRLYLNYIYDALKDLSLLLNVPSNVLSLLNQNNEKPICYVGVSNKGQTNFVVGKNGNIVRSWVYLLDRFLGKENKTGFFNNLDTVDSDTNSARRLINSLKYKELSVDKASLTSDVLEGYKEELDSLLARMPFKTEEDFFLIAAIEDSRNRFIKELSNESLNNMVNTFESHGLSLNSICPNFVELLEKMKSEYENLIIANKNTDLVHTNFYSNLISQCKAEGSNTKIDNLELFVSAVELYVYYKLKDMSCYNNFLVDSDNLKNISNIGDELPLICKNIELFFNEILPEIVNNLNIEEIQEVENNNVEEVKSSVDESNSNDNLNMPLDNSNEIEELKNNTASKKDEVQEDSTILEDILEEDKGKFKLTLFKKLAKEKGLKLSNEKTEKTASGVYYIYFRNDYVKYIRAAIYNNPNQNNHCINIYCGDKGTTKKGYWWDKELNYADLVDFLLQIEQENPLKSNNIIKNNINKNKFKLSAFKEACIKVGLKVDTSESKVVKNNYIINFNNSYILFLCPPVYLDSNDMRSFKIKTLREELFYTWEKELDYKDLILKLVEIEKQGKEALKQEKEEMKKAKNKQIDEKMSEFKDIFDCSEITNTKDIRNKLIKYLSLKNYNVNNSFVFENIKNILESPTNITGSYKVFFDTISEKDLMGRSKAWRLVDNMIILQKRLDSKKQLEGLIESYVTISLSNKKYNSVQKQMIGEGVTFMLCKSANLDVRTYCNSALFEKMVKLDNLNISNYLKQVFKLFDNLIINLM